MVIYCVFVWARCAKIIPHLNLAISLQLMTMLLLMLWLSWQHPETFSGDFEHFNDKRVNKPDWYSILMFKSLVLLGGVHVICQWKRNKICAPYNCPAFTQKRSLPVVCNWCIVVCDWCIVGDMYWMVVFDKIMV